MTAVPPPSPIAYQGSKRRLAPRILDFIPDGARTLIEPFCGSAAVSLAALRTGKVARVHLNDSLAPLAGLWRAIVDTPDRLADAYERLWQAQLADPRAYYDRVRALYNRRAQRATASGAKALGRGAAEPARLLFLLARCVKNAVRFNRDGAFNQSPDTRRLGTQPARMRRHITGAAALLAGRATITAGDYAARLARATPRDVVYLDPPYQGTSGTRDPRYHQSLDLDRLIADLARLVARDVPVIVSFDGRSGDRSYGAALPTRLGLVHLEVNAGRSTQATLHGRTADTVESLYVSPRLSRLREARAGRTTGPRWSS
jgi:DNA adenine methylase